MTTESIVVMGVDLTYRRRWDHWVACLGPHYVVHFYNPPGCCWVGKKPFALEPIATGKTLQDCVIMAKAHYQRIQEESDRRRERAERIADQYLRGQYLR